MPMKEIVRKEIDFLLKLLTEVYPGKNGLLPCRVDVRSGAVLDKRAIVDELGDYASYIIYAGEILGNRRVSEWGINHVINAAKIAQTNLGLFDAQVTTDTPVRNSKRFIYSTQNADTINGLVSSFLISKDERLKKITADFFSGLKRDFLKRGFLSYGVHESAKIKIPIANALTSAYAAEELVNFGAAIGDKQYSDFAYEILKSYIRSSYFRKYGLFPLRICWSSILKPLFKAAFFLTKKPRSDSSIAVKDNCYLIFALLELYKVNKDKEIKSAIDVWFKNFFSKLYQNSGWFFNCWNPNRGPHARSDLQHSHSMIELLMDSFRLFGDENHFKTAKTMADYWLKENSDADYALLDPQVDFAIDLIKLHELTDDEKYLNAARGIFAGIIKNFKLDHGYAWKVDLRSGKVLEANIETKFLGLLLKGFLVYSETESGKKIFKDALLGNIARDR